jgi:hypothetical protein
MLSEKYTLVQKKPADFHKINHLFCLDGSTGEEIDISDNSIFIIDCEVGKIERTIESIVKDTSDKLYIVKYWDITVEESELSAIESQLRTLLVEWEHTGAYTVMGWTRQAWIQDKCTRSNLHNSGDHSKCNAYPGMVFTNSTPFLFGCDVSRKYGFTYDNLQLPYDQFCEHNARLLPQIQRFLKDHDSLSEKPYPCRDYFMIPGSSAWGGLSAMNILLGDFAAGGHALRHGRVGQK